MKILIALSVVVALAQAKDLAQYKSNNLFAIPNKPASTPFNSKISDENEVVPHSYPSAVAIYSDNTKICGGSILNQDVILTAASCAKGAINMEIVAGAHNISNIEPTQQRIKVASVTVHQDYVQVDVINDIALVELSTPIKYNAAVQPIAIDNGDFLSKDLDDTPGTVVGWELSGGVGQSSSVLKEVTNSIISHKKCKKIFYPITVRDTNFCTGSGRKGISGADSGSAFLVTRNGSRVQVGIASYGGGCDSRCPSVFTRIDSYYDWIQENL